MEDRLSDAHLSGFALLSPKLRAEVAQFVFDFGRPGVAEFGEDGMGSCEGFLCFVAAAGSGEGFADQAERTGLAPAVLDPPADGQGLVEVAESCVHVAKTPVSGGKVVVGPCRSVFVADVVAYPQCLLQFGDRALDLACREVGLTEVLQGDGDAPAVAGIPPNSKSGRQIVHGPGVPPHVAMGCTEDDERDGLAITMPASPDDGERTVEVADGGLGLLQLRIGDAEAGAGRGLGERIASAPCGTQADLGGGPPG